MNNIICHECKTENEPQYAYCKNCGAALKSQETESSSSNAQSSYAYNTQQYNAQGYRNTYNPNPYSQNAILDYIDGVASEDIITFVGKKSYSMMPKFTKMTISASKTSWCWPVAVLGYLFGPIGAAIWFFYRKMYKIAMALVGIGLICGIAVSVIEGPNAAYDALDKVYADGSYNNFFSIMEELMQQQTSLRTEVARWVNFLIDMSTVLFTGMFGFHWYKKHTIHSINRYRTMGVDPRYYRLGLASVGGTSTGMAVLGVGILILAEQLFTLITRLL